MRRGIRRRRHIRKISLSRRASWRSGSWFLFLLAICQSIFFTEARLYDTIVDDATVSKQSLLREGMGVQAEAFGFQNVDDEAYDVVSKASWSHFGTCHKA